MPIDLIRRQILAGVVASPAVAGQMSGGQRADAAGDDPGITVMAVGLLTALGATSVATTTKAIQTSGYARTGCGGATYYETSTTGATAWRRQSADGRWWELAGDRTPNLNQFGGDPQAADNTAALAAVYVWATGNGRKVIIPTGIYTYLTRSALPTYLQLQGEGWGSVLKGPGIYWHGTRKDLATGSGVPAGGWVMYAGSAISVRDLTLDGTGYTSSDAHIGLSFLGGNFAHVENVKFIGYRHQCVADVMQRVNFHRNECIATAGTISSFFSPAGTEINAGVSFTLHPTNIVSVQYCHFTYGATDQETQYPLIFHRGRQITVRCNQSSDGRAHIRLGAVGDIVIGQNDFEFTKHWWMETVPTNLTGTAFGVPADSVTLESGNYFDMPMSIPRVSLLSVMGNAFFVSGQAAIQGVASIRSVRSIGNKNNRPGGTILDAMPAGSSTASLVQFDEENFLPVCRANNTKFISDFSINDVFDLSGTPVATAFRNDKGTGRLDGYHAAANTQTLSARYGYVQPGTDVGKGARIYSGVGDPNTTPPAGAPNGESIYIQLLDPAANYRSEYLFWYKNGGTSVWAPLFKPRVLTVAQAGGAKPLVPPIANAEHVTISDSTSNRVPAWGKGGVWRWADGSIVS